MSKAWYTLSFDSEAGRSLPKFSRERTVSIGKTIQWQGCSWEILDLSKTHVRLTQIFEPGTYISFTPQIPVTTYQDQLIILARKAWDLASLSPELDRWARRLSYEECVVIDAYIVGFWAGFADAFATDKLKELP